MESVTISPYQDKLKRRVKSAAVTSPNDDLALNLGEQRAESTSPRGRGHVRKGRRQEKKTERDKISRELTRQL